ncbi:MAG: zinc-ribbon domain-containing protein [Pseudomonadota bacterium]
MSEIECPACNARYSVPASAIGPEGRRVQCAKCGEIWFAKPLPAEAEAAPQPVPEPEPHEQQALAAPADAGGAPAGAASADHPSADHHSADHSSADHSSPEQVQADRVNADADDAQAADAEMAGAERASADMASADAASADGASAETDDFEESLEAEEATAGGQVATLPSSAPRRRRRWRDLRRDAEDVEEEEEQLGAMESGGGGPGNDPFAERLARLRQASLAPDPMPRADQESAIRRKRGENGENGEMGDDADLDALRRDAENGGLDGVDAAAGGAIAARAALEAAEADAPAGGTDPRSDQMAEIRRMLDEMKVPGSRGEAADPEAEKAFNRERDVAGIEKMAPSPAVEARRNDDYVDPLREKLLDPQVKAKRAGPDGEKARAGLMRKHQKRTRRRQRAEQSRKSRGGFYTGLMLVVVTFGILAGVYAFADVIKARVPGTTSAIDEYVGTIDGLRRQLDERLVFLEKRVDEIIKVMSK